jgi:hypothetical protein
MTTAAQTIPLSEKLKSIPGFFGLRLEEEPKYYVLMKDGKKQIRKYYPFIMAQTLIRGDFRFSANEGFYRLANYIFGANTTGEKMSMTTPVFQSKSRKLVIPAPVLHEQKSDGWMMSFVLPSKYKFETIPLPLMDNIELIKVPTLLVATLRYSGTNTEQKINEHSQELIEWIEGKENLKIISEPRSAQYDAPHVLPFFRRNEVQVTVIEIPRRKRNTQ